MADIFISYKTQERHRVQPLVEELLQNGWTVWWDQEIQVGVSIPDAVKRQLKAAKCVVVIWSQESLKSDWVYGEASIARKKGKLVQVLIDDVEDEIPVEFLKVRRADLTGWPRKANHEELELLIESIKSLSPPTGTLKKDVFPAQWYDREKSGKPSIIHKSRAIFTKTIRKSYEKAKTLFRWNFRRSLKSDALFFDDSSTDLRLRFEDFLRSSSMVALIALSLVAGLMTGTAFSCQLSISSFADDVKNLEDYRPPEVTRIYADDGKTVIGELSLERRVLLEPNDIPERMKQAILAIEDTAFFEHLGFNFSKLLMSAASGIFEPPTITQQLASTLFISKPSRLIDKISELIYAIEIERIYSKEQILTMYCNQIFMGGDVYGVEAASNYYFGKRLRELSLEQYAMLAALPKSPTQFSPINQQKAAKDRRNQVLQAMADAAYISENEAEIAKSKPLGLKVTDRFNENYSSPYAYFVEDVRLELQKILVEKLAADAMEAYKAGLQVYTTLDANAQTLATEAVRKNAWMYEKQQGWQVKFDNVIEKENADPNTYEHPSWSNAPVFGTTIIGLIKDIGAEETKVTFGDYSTTITAKHTEAFNRPPSALFKRGDLAQFKIEGVDRDNHRLFVRFDPEPSVQAALLMIEPKTGEVKAMVGGYNFSTSKFNHATQAERQTGSVFKPFIYAAALEQGLKPDDIVDDSPFSKGSYEPHNYDNTFMGPMTIRKAFALSRNIPAIRVLDEIGVRSAADLVKRLKLPKPMAPYLPSALGATEEPLLNMVSAYGVFPNSGVLVDPVRIRKVVDRDGNVLEEANPKQYKVLNDYVAAQMVELMRGTVQFGTAGAASSLGWPIGGKTGTINDFTDAWFIGYTPTVACGVWIGYSDRKRPLGKGETVGTAALPFWIDFMKDYLKDKPKTKFRPIPDIPDEMRPIQAERARKHAAELARIAEREGGLLPGEEPNLDPLADPDSDQQRAGVPRVAKPTPEPVSRKGIYNEPREPVVRATEQKPKILRPPVGEPVRKGKRGKIE